MLKCIFVEGLQVRAVGNLQGLEGGIACGRVQYVYIKDRPRLCDICLGATMHVEAGTGASSSNTPNYCLCGLCKLVCKLSQIN